MNEKREFEFGNRLYGEKLKEDDDSRAYEFLDSVINMYLLGLGEFELAFKGND